MSVGHAASPFRPPSGPISGIHTIQRISSRGLHTHAQHTHRTSAHLFGAWYTARIMWVGTLWGRFWHYIWTVFWLNGVRKSEWQSSWFNAIVLILLITMSPIRPTISCLCLPSVATVVEVEREAPQLTLIIGLARQAVHACEISFVINTFLLLVFFLFFVVAAVQLFRMNKSEQWEKLLQAILGLLARYTTHTFLIWAFCIIFKRLQLKADSVMFLCYFALFSLLALFSRASSWYH